MNQWVKCVHYQVRQNLQLHICRQRSREYYVERQEARYSEKQQIQCIATDAFTSEKTVPLGSTQSPGLTDYADGIDTLKFLIEI